MDPDEALAIIRDLVASTERNSTLLKVGAPAQVRAFVGVASHLAGTVKGLDEWISRDGFLPAAWQHHRGRDRFNGWVNRETWAMHLHLSNDEGLYAMTRDLVRGAEDEDGATAALQTWVNDLLADELETTELGRMMLREVGSLWRVDWPSIARAFSEES